MRRKIASLLLVLAMLLSVVPSVNIAYADDAPVVNFRFYADEALTQPITTQVEVGTIVYGAFSLENAKATTQLNAMIGFDEQYLQLVPFGNSETPVAFSDQKGVKQTEIESRGVRVFNALQPLFGSVFPRFDTLNNGIRTVTLSFMTPNAQVPTDLIENTNLVALKFKTMQSGTTKLYSPSEQDGDGCFLALYWYGIKLMNADEEKPYVVYKDARPDPDDYKVFGAVNTAEISIYDSNALKQPQNVRANDENSGFLWDAVEGADGYQIVITPSNSNITEPITMTVTTPGYTLPADAKYGKFDITVQAIKNDDPTAGSPVANASLTKTYTLPAVGTVTLTKGDNDALNASWDAVEGADHYEVTVYENGAPKGEVIEVPADTLSVDVAAYVDAPANGKNTYYVTVAAKGDETYTLTDPAVQPAKSDSVSYLGAVGAPTQLKWEGTAAAWSKGVDPENVAGYEVTLKKGAQTLTTQPVDGANTTSFDFSNYMTSPADYYFEVKAIGKEIEGIGKYLDSAVQECGEPYTKSEPLKKVENIAWEGRVITWTDPNTNLNKAYSVDLYKMEGDQAVPVMQNIRVYEPTLDFDTVDETPDKSMIGVGDYKAVVTAIGDGKYYTTGEPAESPQNFAAERLAPPTGLTWTTPTGGTDKTVASWDAVPGAQDYEAYLYYNGVIEVARATVTGTSIDWSDVNGENHMTMPGDFTFGVRASETANKMESAEAKTDEKTTVNANTVGAVSLETYADEESTNDQNKKLSNFKAGDTFYIAVRFTNDTGADLNFDAATIPISYNKEYVNIQSAQPADGFKDVRTDIKNENGLAVLDIYYDTANETPNAVLADGESIVLAVFEANALMTKSSPVEIGFAVAGPDKAYDSLSPYGFTYFLEGAPFYAAQTDTAVNIAKGKLPKPAAPTWEGKTITWKPYDSDAANSTVKEYEVKLYKGDELDKTFTVGKDELSKDLSEYIKGSAAYTVTVKAISKDPENIADNSDESDPSDKYKAPSVPSSSDGDSVVSTKYAIEVADTDGGSVVAKPTVAAKGSRVKLTVKPKDGYEIDKIKVTDQNGNEIPVEEKDGAYTFVMPGSKVTVTPTFKKEGTVSFNDIEGHWAEDAIREIAGKGLVIGYGDGTFRPDWGITRAEFTKLMIECLGLKVSDEEGKYDDTKDHWAKDYINLGTELGIVNGIGDNLFAPDEIILREQIAAILFRMAGKPEGAEISTYADRDQVTEYAKPGVDFVTANKYMIGMEDNLFKPAEKTTRAQVATILVRLFRYGFFDSLEIKGGDSVFETGDFTPEQGWN